MRSRVNGGHFQTEALPKISLSAMPSLLNQTQPEFINIMAALKESVEAKGWQRRAMG
jgi:hypothetical protein